MNPDAIVVLVCSAVMLALILALVREVRLRRALERLLARILSYWRNAHATRPLSDEDAGRAVADGHDRV
jgi:hypothetical protein